MPRGNVAQAPNDPQDRKKAEHNRAQAASWRREIVSRQNARISEESRKVGLAERVEFVHARDEPKASWGVPEFSLDASDRA